MGFAFRPLIAPPYTSSGKSKSAYLTLKIGESEMEYLRSDLTPLGALPFLFPLPNDGDCFNVYSDGVFALSRV